MGLDNVHPFSETSWVDVILQEAENMLSPNLQAVGLRNAARIWGFMSKFVMLDRLSKTLGAGKVYPGLSVPRKTCSMEYLGTGVKVSVSPNLFDTANATSDPRGSKPTNETARKVPEKLGRSGKNKGPIFSEGSHLAIYRWTRPCQCHIKCFKATD